MKICIPLLQRHAFKQSGNARFIAAAYTKLYEACQLEPAAARGIQNYTLAKFWMSYDHEMTKGLLSNVLTLRFTSVLDVRGAGHEERVAQTTCPRRIKKGRNFLKRGRLFEEQPFSAAILSTFLSRLSHQASSAAILAAILKLLVILLWSVVGGQLLVNY